MDILLQKLAETQEIMRGLEKKLADVGNRLDQIHALVEREVKDKPSQTEEQDASREDRY